MTIDRTSPRTRIWDVLNRLRDRHIEFLRVAALPGDRWEDGAGRWHAAVIGFDHRRIRLELTPARGRNPSDPWPATPGESPLVVTIDPSDRRWQPIAGPVPTNGSQPPHTRNESQCNPSP